jgi:hypothetical protein
MAMAEKTGTHNGKEHTGSHTSGAGHGTQTAQRAASGEKSQRDDQDHAASHRITAKNLTDEDRRFLEEHADELGRTTLRAKWIHGRDEHADRAGQSLATRDHATIQRWAAERKAEPATVPGTEHEDRPGVLRFDFPGYGGRSLQHVPWEDWFSTFDQRQLVFVFQEQKRDGTQSNFFILDNPEREEG